MESKLLMVTCPICQESYKTPKYLPCLHSFCESCLNGYICNIAKICQKVDKLPASIFDSKPFVWTGDGFPCPVCRMHVQVADAKSLTSEEWASTFPINHLIQSVLGRTHISENMPCGPCEKIKDPKVAHDWCMDCSEALCEACSKHHQVLKATDKHSIAKIADIKDKSTLFKHSEITQCHLHNGKEIQTYCVDHNKVVCVECVTTEHVGCVDLITIDKVAAEIRNSSEPYKLLDKLKECTEETECVVMDRKRNIDKLQASKKAMLEKVDQIRDDINRVLDELHDMFSDDFDVVHSRVVNDIEDQTGRCFLLQKAIDSSRGVLQAALTHGTDNELFVVAHRMEKELHKYEAVLERESANLNEVEYEFEVNYEVEHLLMTLEEFGSIKVHRTPTNPSPFAKKHATMMTQFAATSPMDERCAELTGGTFLPDDRLVLVDTANEKLKLFTSEGELISELELSSAPWDITCIPGGMAAVTLPVEKRVMMVSGLNDCITPIEQFTTSGKCYGIAYSYKTKDLVVACDIPSEGRTTVKVMTLAGEEVRDIMVEEDGQRIMSRPSHVATNPFNSDVYVSDECNDTVIGMTLKGEFRFRHSETYLKLPVGIASDNHGCIYVCGNGSCDVHQLSRDGLRHRLLMDGLPHPRAIAFDPYGERFLVTSDGSYKSTVQVYQLT